MFKFVNIHGISCIRPKTKFSFFPENIAPQAIRKHVAAFLEEILARHLISLVAKMSQYGDIFPCLWCVSTYTKICSTEATEFLQVGKLLGAAPEKSVMATVSFD